MFSERTQPPTIFDEHELPVTEPTWENNFRVTGIKSANEPAMVSGDAGKDYPFATWTKTEFMNSGPSIPSHLGTFHLGTDSLPDVPISATFYSEGAGTMNSPLFHQSHSNANAKSSIKELPFTGLETVTNTGFAVTNVQNDSSHSAFQSVLIPQESFFSEAFGIVPTLPILDVDVNFCSDEVTASSADMLTFMSLVRCCIKFYTDWEAWSQDWEILQSTSVQELTMGKSGVHISHEEKVVQPLDDTPSQLVTPLSVISNRHALNNINEHPLHTEGKTKRYETTKNTL
jgi:hypothetical protein